MKPYFLAVEGLFSFFNKQEINFEKLAEGGIFGIFGPTGSGKSAVLDSIVFSLYGDTGRGDNHQIINIRSKSAQVCFIFSMLIDGARKKFEVSRGLKRKKDGTAEQFAILSEVFDGGKKALCEGSLKVNKKIEEIIGLSLKEFKKCIAIPQGEFASFIKTTHSEQALIMGRLFSLEELGEGLSKKLNIYTESVEREKANIDGQLTGYKDITKEREIFLKNTENEINEKLKVLNLHMSDLAKLKKERETIFEKYEKLQGHEKELSELVKLTDVIAKKRNGIELCKKAAEIYPKMEKTVILFDEEKEAFEKNSENEKTLQIKNKLLKIFEDSYLENKNKLENIKTELILKLDRTSFLFDEQNKLKDYEIKIKKLRQDFTDVSSNLNDDKNALDVCKKNLENIASEIFSLKEKSNGLDLKISKLVSEKENEILKAQHEIFKETDFKFNKDLKQAEKQFIKVSAHFEGFKGYLRDGLIETGKYMITDSGLGVIDSFEALTHEKLKIGNRLNELEKEKEELNSKILSLNSGISKNDETLLGIKKEGESLNELIKQSQKIFSNAKIDAGCDISEVQKTLKSELEIKNSELKNLETEKVNVNFEAQNSKAELIKSEEILKLKNLQRIAAEKESLEYLQKAGFKNISEVNSYYSKKDNLEFLVKEVNQYDSRMLELNFNIKNLAGELNGKKVSLEELNETLNRYETVNSEIKALGENKAVILQQVKKYKEDELALKQIQKKNEGVLKRLQTAELLKKAVKGKALMDFAVQEYFTDITFAASEKLIFLSDGQYELIYDNSFFVKDNLNGGELRDIITLSGGETFLISLSLALSLSEAIVSLSNKPIEFFFLDEGFGTLDSNLIDIVMVTLEKLVKTHFSIGLISHVPELKQRIISKLNLEKINGSSRIISEF